MGFFARLMERMDRQSLLMSGMMERLGVDFASRAGDACGHRFERAVRSCTFCSHGAQCKAWQDTHPQGAEDAPSFCPNAEYWTSTR